MRTLNLNSGEIELSTSPYILCTCVYSNGVPVTLCTVSDTTPCGEVRVGDSLLRSPRHFHTVPDGDIPMFPMDMVSFYGKLDVRSTFVTILPLYGVVYSLSITAGGSCILCPDFISCRES